MFSKTQQASGVPIGDTDVRVNTIQYLLTPPSLISCASVASYTEKTAAQNTIDLEKSSGVNFPNISQGSSNMCSSFAMAHAYALRHAIQFPGIKIPYLSPLFAYYYQRINQCSTEKACVCPTTQKCDPPCLDCGSLLESAVLVFSVGVCKMTEWPYTLPMNLHPSDAAIENSEKYKIITATCVETKHIQRALENGFPVVAFLYITQQQEDWMSSQLESVATSDEGVLFPKLSGPVIAGHVVLLVGATDTNYIVKNNFGNNWGYNGRFCIPKRNFTKEQVRKCVQIENVSCGSFGCT